MIRSVSATVRLFSVAASFTSSNRMFASPIFLWASMQPQVRHIAVVPPVDVLPGDVAEELVGDRYRCPGRDMDGVECDEPRERAACERRRQTPTRQWLQTKSMLHPNALVDGLATTRPPSRSSRAARRSWLVARSSIRASSKRRSEEHTSELQSPM